jgi:hypothetical protein
MRGDGMSITFVCPAETRDKVLAALDEAHGRLEQAASFADALYHHYKAEDYRRAADRCVSAMRLLARGGNA